MTTYDIPHDPKTVREALCQVETLILLYRPDQPHYAKIIGDLIKECERKRPLGPDGKHGNLHTPECGCDDIVIANSQEYINELYDPHRRIRRTE